MGLGHDEDYLTTTQVVSLTRWWGPLRLSKRMFDLFVANGAAPQPAARRGGEPLWDRPLIAEWAEGELQSLLDGQARRLLIAKGRDTVTPAFPDLSKIRLDASLPTHAAVLKAEGELSRQIENVLRLCREVSRRLARLPDTNESQRRSLISRWRKRPLSTSDVRAGLEHDREVLHVVERRLADDLDSCRAWTYELLSWAEAEALNRRTRALEETYHRDEEMDRYIKIDGLTCFASPEEFVAGDARRLAYHQQDPGQDRRVVLAGADFGYGWRHDDTDNEHVARSGTWRVSWISSNGEMYGVDRASGVVVLIGTAKTSFDHMVAWMLDLENRQRERNSLSLVLQAFREQARAGYPSIPSVRLLEGG